MPVVKAPSHELSCTTKVPNQKPKSIEWNVRAKGYPHDAALPSSVLRRLASSSVTAASTEGGLSMTCSCSFCSGVRLTRRVLMNPAGGNAIQVDSTSFSGSSTGRLNPTTGYGPCRRPLRRSRCLAGHFCRQAVAKADSEALCLLPLNGSPSADRFLQDLSSSVLGQGPQHGSGGLHPDL